MKTITIALDVMSGDHGLYSVVPAAFQQLKQDPQLQLLLVGDQTQIKNYLEKHQLQLNTRISIQHASEIVAMDELPSHALRNKKDSSLRVAIEQIKLGKADAVVSAGNTGALMATARFVLKMFPDIYRPAIITTIPTIKQKTVKVLDMGANVNCSAEQLLQFALMGSIMRESVENIKNPKIGLLNIGSEEIKGNTLVKAAAKLIQGYPQINYVGYVEGDDIFSGEVDVVVCDGFVGNAVLKASEGIANMMLSMLKKSFHENWLSRLRGLIAKPALKPLQRTFNPEIYNGSCLLGLKGIVIKSHGSANALAFESAIKEAKLAVKQNLPQKIAVGLQAL